MSLQSPFTVKGRLKQTDGTIVAKRRTAVSGMKRLGLWAKIPGLESQLHLLISWVILRSRSTFVELIFSSEKQKYLIRRLKTSSLSFLKQHWTLRLFRIYTLKTQQWLKATHYLRISKSLTSLSLSFLICKWRIFKKPTKRAGTESNEMLQG